MSIPATYQSTQLTVQGRVTDLSPEGLFLASPFLDVRGEVAHVALEVSGAALKLRGEVRWVRESARDGGMGIEFVDVSLGDRLTIAALVAGMGVDPAWPDLGLELTT